MLTCQFRGPTVLSGWMGLAGLLAEVLAAGTEHAQSEDTGY
jgi:hypothetical protein